MKRQLPYQQLGALLEFCYLSQRDGARPEPPCFANGTVWVAEPTARRSLAVASAFVRVSFSSGHVVGAEEKYKSSLVPKRNIDVLYKGVHV